MKINQFIAIYACMLAFDLGVLAGTAYLISERGWSGWWMLFAILVCAGSNPRPMINDMKAGEV